MRVIFAKARKVGKAKDQSKARGQSGQMTMELMVALPALLLVGVIAVNALLFFGECAAFDRTARHAIRLHGSVPAAGETLQQSIEAIKNDVASALDIAASDINVRAEAMPPALTRITVELRYEPTLFGLRLQSSLFGVRLPRLTHRTALVVDRYRPGVLF